MLRKLLSLYCTLDFSTDNGWTLMPSPYMNNALLLLNQQKNPLNGYKIIVNWITYVFFYKTVVYNIGFCFQVIRPDKSENWTLQIKFPQERDAGIYECQVNTEPKMSLAFQLNVVGKCITWLIYSFKLFLVYSRVDRGNQVLRHSV